MKLTLWRVNNLWIRFWMRFAGLSSLGRVAPRLASWTVPSYYGRWHLARFNPHGYIAPSASIHHNDLYLGANVFIDDRVTIYQSKDGGPVELAERVHIHRDTIIQTGAGGSVKIGAKTYIQPRCQFSAYKAAIRIGCGVQIAPNCSFYPYNHGIAPDQLISSQPLQTKGDITVDDDAWLGVGVIVLSGVKIGKGAVIGAGAVAAGVPARVMKMRCNLQEISADTKLK